MMIAATAMANAQNYVKFIEHPMEIEIDIEIDELAEAIVTADTIYHFGTNFCLKTETNNKWDLFMLVKDPDGMVYDLSIITKDGLYLSLGEPPYTSKSMDKLNRKVRSKSKT